MLRMFLDYSRQLYTLIHNTYICQELFLHVIKILVIRNLLWTGTIGTIGNFFFLVLVSEGTNELQQSEMQRYIPS